MADIIAKRTKHIHEQTIVMPHMHSHPHYEMYYLTQGDRSYFIGDKIYRVVSGDIALISPNMLHKAAGPTSEFIHLYFDRHALTAQMARVAERCFKNPIIRLRPKYRSVVERILGDMCFETDARDTNSSLMLTALLTQLLIELCRFSSIADAAPAAEDEMSDMMLDITSFVNKHYSEDISASSLSAMSFLSRSHFCRKFKQIVGVTPVEYINGIRVNEAVNLLHDTNLPITEISLRVGFSNSNYFGDVFKKYKGISPREYRTSIK